MGGSYVPPSSRRANMMAEKEGGSTSPSSLPPASPAGDSDVSGSPPNEGKGARGYQGGGGGGNRGKGGGKGGKGKGGKRGDEDVRTSWGNAATDEASYEHLFRNTRHQAGLHFDKYKEIPVDVTSSDPCPVPLDTFDNSGLHQLLLDNVERYKYRVPTPVQRYSVPIMMTGKDVMACAQTGSGKTAAFLFPIIHILLAAGPRPFRKRLKWGQVAPESLVLAPTRELAMQIFEESQKFCYKTGLRSVSVYGGMDMRGQVQELDKGCQILVATPGRLIDLCTPRQRGDSQSTNHPKISLSNIYVFCIDEADRMLDMGFEMQMRQIVQKLEMPPKSEIQTMMFSATFPAPIQRLAADFLSEPFFFIKVGQIGSTNLQITQNLEYCSEARKPEFLVALLRHHTAGPKKLVLVFVDTKHSANELVNRLQSEGFNAATIHGDRTQQEREYALVAFKRGEIPILVATDVASRGLDIPNVSHVVQYDLASHLDDYTHRIGRTGRAGNTGLATAFFNEKNRGIGKSLLSYLQQHDQDVPQKLSDIVTSAPTLNTRGGKGGKGGKGGGKGGKDFGTADAGRTVSRKQMLETQQANAEPQSTYSAGNMMMSMMGASGGQY